jgi:hypothetical protein
MADEYDTPLTGEDVEKNVVEENERLGEALLKARHEVALAQRQAKLMEARYDRLVRDTGGEMSIQIQAELKILRRRMGRILAGEEWRQEDRLREGITALMEEFRDKAGDHRRQADREEDSEEGWPSEKEHAKAGVYDACADSLWKLVSDELRLLLRILQCQRSALGH